MVQAALVSPLQERQLSRGLLTEVGRWPWVLENKAAGLGDESANGLGFISLCLLLLVESWTNYLIFL